jgi:hypothetical protein
MPLFGCLATVERPYDTTLERLDIPGTACCANVEKFPIRDDSVEMSTEIIEESEEKSLFRSFRIDDRPYDTIDDRDDRPGMTSADVFCLLPFHCGIDI